MAAMAAEMFGRRPAYTSPSPYALSYDDPLSPPEDSSGPSAGEIFGTLLAVGVGVALLGGVLSGESSVSEEGANGGQERWQPATEEEDDSETGLLTNGLYGNCHGGLFYGCP